MDLVVFHFINQFAGKNTLLDGLANFLANYFQYVIALVIFIFLFKIFKKNVKESWRIGVSILAAIFLSRIVITEIIRYVFPKLRPFVNGPANLIFDKNAAEPSMPSGHAALFFALAMAVYFYNKKLGISLFIAAFLISVSRVFAGVHWPSDILVGALIGIISGWLVHKIFQKYFKTKTPQ
jgi:undecaprenyl-diphosphatase